jgi:hypothetical protein
VIWAARPILRAMAPAQSPLQPQRRRIGLAKALLSRHVLDRRLTSAATLGGIVLGAIVGQVCGSFLDGVWIGLIVGFAAPGPVAYALDRVGRLPESALYKRLRP